MTPRIEGALVATLVALVGALAVALIEAALR